MAAKKKVVPVKKVVRAAKGPKVGDVRYLCEEDGVVKEVWENDGYRGEWEHVDTLFCPACENLHFCCGVNEWGDFPYEKLPAAALPALKEFVLKHMNPSNGESTLTLVWTVPFTRQFIPILESLGWKTHGKFRNPGSNNVLITYSYRNLKVR